MSELINTQKANNSLHWRLLTSVSSLALLAAICGTQGAFAERFRSPYSMDRTGADLDRVDGGQQAFAPAFVVNNSGSTAFDPISPAEAQKPPSFSFGGEGKLSIEPEGADWVFSASVRYGRSNSNRQVHQTAKNKPVYQHLVFNTPYFPNHTLIAPSNHTPFTANFFAAQEELSESHAVIDFQVGKDLGIGLFGREGMSVLNVGVKIRAIHLSASFEPASSSGPRFVCPSLSKRVSLQVASLWHALCPALSSICRDGAGRAEFSRDRAQLVVECVRPIRRKSREWGSVVRFGS